MTYYKFEIQDNRDIDGFYDVFYPEGHHMYGLVSEHKTLESAKQYIREHK